jgi:hypothetical protein
MLVKENGQAGAKIRWPCTQPESRGFDLDIAAAGTGEAAPHALSIAAFHPSRTLAQNELSIQTVHWFRPVKTAGDGEVQRNHCAREEPQDATENHHAKAAPDISGRIAPPEVNHHIQCGGSCQYREKGQPKDQSDTQDAPVPPVEPMQTPALIPFIGGVLFHGRDPNPSASAYHPLQTFGGPFYNAAWSRL